MLKFYCISLLLSLCICAGADAFAAIAVDANVSADVGTKNTHVVSPVFSTNAGNELLLAFISADYRTGANTTVTSISGGGLTWTLVKRSNGQSGTAE